VAVALELFKHQLNILVLFNDYLCALQDPKGRFSLHAAPHKFLLQCTVFDLNDIHIHLQE